MTNKISYDEDGTLSSLSAASPKTVSVEKLDDGEWRIVVDGHQIILYTKMNREIYSDYTTHPAD